MFPWSLSRASPSVLPFREITHLLRNGPIPFHCHLYKEQPSLESFFGLLPLQKGSEWQNGCLGLILSVGPSGPKLKIKPRHR